MGFIKPVLLLENKAAFPSKVALSGEETPRLCQLLTTVSVLLLMPSRHSLPQPLQNDVEDQIQSSHEPSIRNLTLGLMLFSLTWLHVHLVSEMH